MPKSKFMGYFIYIQNGIFSKNITILFQ